MDVVLERQLKEERVVENKKYKRDLTGRIRVNSSSEDTVIKSVLLVSFFIFVFSLYKLDMEWSRYIADPDRVKTVISRYMNPRIVNTDIIFKAYIESIQTAIAATFISVTMALVLGVLAAENISPNKFVSRGIKYISSFIRAFPTAFWVLFFVAALGFGPFAGVVGLLFHSVAYLVKAFSGSIEEMDSGIIEAMKATGASYLQVVCRGVIPTVAVSLLAWSSFRFETNIKSSTILGMVGAGGIGARLSRSLRLYDFHEASFIILLIIIFTYLMELIFRRKVKEYLK